MKYMLFICTDPEAPQYVAAEDNIKEWGAEMDERGISLHGDRLRPVEDATTVRVRSGEVLVSDGPFTEAKEWIAGYDIIACEDLDEAIEGRWQWHEYPRWGVLAKVNRAGAGVHR